MSRSKKTKKATKNVKKQPAKKPAAAAAAKAKTKPKAAPKKKEPAAKKEAPPPKKAAAEAKAPAAKAAKPAKARKKSAAAAKPITARGEAKPGLGYKWACYQCNAKFYDLGKPDPVCPRCGADQRTRPASDAPSPPPAPRRPAQPPMARYLDEEEAPAEGEAFVDEGEEEAAELDIEAIEETGAFVEPDYEDE
jgi:hypothetical protein